MAIRKIVPIWFGIVLAMTGWLRAAPQSAPLPADTQRRALLNRYCVTCHNEKLQTAGLLLDKLDVEIVAADAKVWEAVVRKLRTGAMPPSRAPRPDQSAIDQFAQYLETELDRAASAHPDPGRPVIRRLSRAEYTNSIRDLLAIDTEAMDFRSLLPPDETALGFDNMADVLSVSPALLEQYLSAARTISRVAVGDPAAGPDFQTYHAPKYLMQEEFRMGEDFPFGSRGGMAVRHYFPLEGEYLVQVRLQRNARDYIRGLGEAHELDVRVDGARIESFTIGGEIKGESAGIFSSASQGDIEQEQYERFADAGLEVRVPVSAGAHVVAVSFPQRTVVPEGPLVPRLTQVNFAAYKGGDPAVGSITIGGPFDAGGLGETRTRQRIFLCHPASTMEEEPCAREILSTLARRAYRRRLLPEDLETLIGFFRAGHAKAGFEAGIGAALERILLGPEFLFRIEREPAGVAPNTAYRISDVELATRLSFFLWSSLPDDELLELTEQGELRQPGVLERQVRRMLADGRSEALVRNFAGQWLMLRNLRAMDPDPEAFPYFDDNLRENFQQETELFFESLLREDRSVLDLLRADYTFLNERLARHYGIPNVYGNHFRRVPLEDLNRRGLLGQGSLLTLTSYANRTSPVLRGKWVLDNFLGTPPPPPPANVPSLKDRGPDGLALPVRKRMEQHRANPACATCHNLMDPIGFALENFDGIGLWRTTEANAPIDATGVLPDGSRFAGPAGLSKLLLEHKGEQFVGTVTEKLLTYALGRGLEHYDAPAVRKIVRDAARSEYRWSEIILGMVRSVPFQMRRSHQP